MGGYYTLYVCLSLETLWDLWGFSANHPSTLSEFYPATIFWRSSLRWLITTLRWLPWITVWYFLALESWNLRIDLLAVIHPISGYLLGMVWLGCTVGFPIRMGDGMGNHTQRLSKSMRKWCYGLWRFYHHFRTNAFAEHDEANIIYSPNSNLESTFMAISSVLQTRFLVPE